jgi:hypothetical protein
MKKNYLRYFVAACLIMAVPGFIQAQMNKDQIARLHYDGGGDWYNNPDMIPNMVEVLNRELQTDFSQEEAVVTPGESRLFQYPFVIMTGHGNITFSEREADNLRAWLLRGGVLYADDDYGMDEAFRREIKKVFPERQLVELPAEHEIFNCYYKFSGTPKIHKHDDKRPQSFAIYDDTGRIMVIYTYESNITDGWSDAHEDPPETRQNAFRFGVNMLYHIFTSG